MRYGQFGRWDNRYTVLEALVRRMEEAEAAGDEARAGRYAAKLMAEYEDWQDEWLPLITNQALWLRITCIQVPPVPDTSQCPRCGQYVLAGEDCICPEVVF